VLPGDRIYVSADPLICLDNNLAKAFAPVERVLGLALLAGSVRSVFQSNSGNNNNGVGFITTPR